MSDKTKEVLLRIIRDHENATVTVIMKTCYLVDYVAKQRLGSQITDFKYVRYNYGPFDSFIYKCLDELISNDFIVGQAFYFGMGNEVITYEPADKNLSISRVLNADEEKVVDEILLSVRGLGAKILTEIAYKTAPMKSIGATLGGKESLGVSLDLGIKN